MKVNLRQRYKFKGKRRITRFLVAYIWLVFFLTFYSTFARYATIVEDLPTLEIANWEIKINDEEVVNGQILSNIITLVPDSTTQTTTDNKLAPGHKGYFDITINPSGTEVSVEYSIDFQTTNLPEGLTLTTYEILEDNMSGTLSNNNITGTINLESIVALGETDSKTIRTYWEWEENDNLNIPTGNENYNITAIITINQVL